MYYIFNYKYNELKEINKYIRLLNSLDFLSKNKFTKSFFFVVPISDIIFLSIINSNYLIEMKIWIYLKLKKQKYLLKILKY